MLYEPSSRQRERIAHLGMYTSFLHPIFPLCSHVIERRQAFSIESLNPWFMSPKKITGMVDADSLHHPLQNEKKN